MEYDDDRTNANKYRLLDRKCICGRHLDTWDVRCSRAVGFLEDHQHLCIHCLAECYEVTVEYFAAYLEREFGMEPCLGYR